MLTSLFGDLGPPKDTDASKRDQSAGHAREPNFAATAIMESVATEVNARGQMVDRHSQDLVVTGSPAQAIRDHFASTRADLQTATALITLLDPAGVWAAAVIKALSDAGGRPIERLHLRDRTTLRTLATIERTTLVRRQEETLRIYRADVRAPGNENAEISVALMERSQMTTVIIGPLQPHAIDALLAELLAAARLATWRCPNLLFMVPPSAAWITARINAITWPIELQVHVLSESMSSASSVWNAMLSMWNQVKSAPVWADTSTLPMPVTNAPHNEISAEPQTVKVPPRAPSPAPVAQMNDAKTVRAALPGVRHGLDPARVRQALTHLLALDGVLGGAVVDGSTGLALALRTRNDRAVDMNLAAAASAQVLQAHRQASRSMGMTERIDEVMTSAGARQQVIRALARLPELFLVAVLDKRRTNLALVRLHLIEIERALV